MVGPGLPSFIAPDLQTSLYRIWSSPLPASCNARNFSWDLFIGEKCYKHSFIYFIYRRLKSNCKQFINYFPQMIQVIRVEVSWMRSVERRMYWTCFFIFTNQIFSSFFCADLHLKKGRIFNRHNLRLYAHAANCLYERKSLLGII